MSINKLINQIKKDTIKRETEVRTKIIYPLLDELKYKRENIVDEFPVYAKEGRKDLPAKSADIMIFSNSGANNYKENNEKDVNWVRNNSLIAIELKKPSEKIEEAKEQATFYAMWTRCLIYIITNGEDIEIYQLKDFSADILLFAGKILDLNSKWDELYRTLHFNSLKQKKINPIIKPKEVVISSNCWEEISFDEERDITDAILGNKLFPYNVKSCPELPILKSLKENLELVNYAIIKGVSGCGKSITAYQLGNYYRNKGFNVYRYINNNDEFDYDIKSLVSEKSVFIIDDLQNISNILIDKIIANTSENLKFICTITDDIAIEAESIYLSTSESIRTIKDYYIDNKELIYDIVHKIDSNINDTYLSETLEDRLDKAEKEANSPWMFNYILRGGWNSAKRDYHQAKDNKRFDWLLLYIALNQIAYLDKPINLVEVEKILEFIEYDKKWITTGLEYLVKNKILVEENNDYRCIHIRYASLIIKKMSYDLSKEEKQILINMIRKIIIDKDISLQGISWLLNEFRSHDLLYYEKNIINEKIWKTLKERCFYSKNDIEIRNACFVLDILIRLYSSAKEEILQDKIDQISEWINNINFVTGFALKHLINELLDYKDINNLVNKEFQNKINFLKIAEQINNANHKDLGAIGCFLERLWIFEKDIIKKELIANIDTEAIVNNIIKNKENIDIWFVSYFISTLYEWDKDTGLLLYDNLEELYIYKFKQNALESYEAVEERLLWSVFNFSRFDNKIPAKKYINRLKKLINVINEKKLAYDICNSSNHDWERYARLINIINIVDKNITKKILYNIDYDIFNNNLNKYWEKLPREMRLILIELAEATDDYEPIKSLIEKNFNKIKIAEPILTYICPDIVKHCYENNKNIDIFGYNGSCEEALDMLKIIEKNNFECFNSAVSQAMPKLIQKIESIVPMSGFFDTSVSDFINYINDKSSHELKNIFENLNVDITAEHIKRYCKEKKKNKYANKTLATICKYLIKYNEKLKDLAIEILNKIPQKYK